MARDEFPSRVKDQLARRVNHRCSNPDCRAPTSGPQLAYPASMSVGVAAHITAASTRGPRFNRNLQSQDRSSADNGIWLCQTCAKLVDSDEARFTAPLLRARCAIYVFLIILNYIFYSIHVYLRGSRPSSGRSFASCADLSKRSIFPSNRAADDASKWACGQV
jgi:hypothetical protein